jgi:hypothetical protein
MRPRVPLYRAQAPGLVLTTHPASDWEFVCDAQRRPDPLRDS